MQAVSGKLAELMERMKREPVSWRCPLNQARMRHVKFEEELRQCCVVAGNLRDVITR